MKLNRKSGLALVLIFFGALILLHKIGIHTGHLMGILFPIAMIGLGYLGVVNGKKMIGSVIGVLGVLILLGTMSGLIGIAIAVGFICYGVTLLRKKSESI
jgi:predicted membrane protein